MLCGEGTESTAANGWAIIQKGLTVYREMI